MEFKHVPVLLDEVIENLNIKEDGIYIDLTVGGAGHSLEILKRLKSGKLICVDQDVDALEVSKQRLLKFSKNVFFYKSNFENFNEILDYFNIDKVDGVLLDIGVSSYQLDNKDRGFSYMLDAKLDMRMDKSIEKSAFDVINFYSEKELENIFYKYGEEKWTKRIVKFILEERKVKNIETTFDLVRIIEKAIPKAVRMKEKNPAKRVFQAVRIEVNRELDVIKNVIPDIVNRLKTGGRLCVITFHSLEDRIVKDAFKELSKGCICPREIYVCVCNNKPKVKILTKKPIIPSSDEIIKNSRSKSSKLRVCEKI